MTEKKTDKNKNEARKQNSKDKPYEFTYNETYVEPVGMGPVKEK